MKKSTFSLFLIFTLLKTHAADEADSYEKLRQSSPADLSKARREYLEEKRRAAPLVTSAANSSAAAAAPASDLDSKGASSSPKTHAQKRDTNLFNHERGLSLNPSMTLQSIRPNANKVVLSRAASSNCVEISMPTFDTLVLTLRKIYDRPYFGMLAQSNQIRERLKEFGWSAEQIDQFTDDDFLKANTKRMELQGLSNPAESPSASSSSSTPSVAGMPQER
ncbi:MAG: hypothetical protein FJX71_06275 [Alphaproteobacteria bacterium]|nr:hypothetical protein [Alphaproteobacteria bacterium]